MGGFVEGLLMDKEESEVCVAPFWTTKGLVRGSCPCKGDCARESRGGGKGKPPWTRTEGARGCCVGRWERGGG